MSLFDRLKKAVDALKDPNDKFSVGHLKELYEYLLENRQLKDKNQVTVIETLREIAELLIWSDQHAEAHGIFDFFLEKNILEFFVQIVTSTTVPKQVKVQVLQTLSILVENLSSETSLYFVFSNNYLNDMIAHKFDFSDEELLAYYISFLKSISLKLNDRTIVFFFNPMENEFPLYTEAIKFFKHDDPMIRIAVRTLTLNVFRVTDEKMRKFVLDRTAIPYFSNIIFYVRGQCFQLNLGKSSSSKRLDDFVADLADYFYYINDVFHLGIVPLANILSDHLLRYLLLSVFVNSLQPQNTEKLMLPVTPEGDAQGETVTPLLACFLLAQVLHIYTYKPLVNTLGAFLFHPTPRTTIPSTGVIFPDYDELRVPDAQGGGRNKYRKFFCSQLLASDDDQVSLAALCVLHALIRNSGTSRFLLEQAGLSLQRQAKAKRLLESLTGGADPSADQDDQTTELEQVRRQLRTALSSDGGSASANNLNSSPNRSSQAGVASGAIVPPSSPSRPLIAPHSPPGAPAPSTNTGALDSLSIFGDDSNDSLFGESPAVAPSVPPNSGAETPQPQLSGSAPLSAFASSSAGPAASALSKRPVDSSSTPSNDITATSSPLPSSASLALLATSPVLSSSLSAAAGDRASRRLVMGQISDQVALHPSPSSEKRERELLHRQWVDKLLALLRAHRNHSITTLKLAIMVLKDLVYAEGEPAALNPDQVAALCDAHDSVVAELKQALIRGATTSTVPPPPAVTVANIAAAAAAAASTSSTNAPSTSSTPAPSTSATIPPSIPSTSASSTPVAPSSIPAPVVATSNVSPAASTPPASDPLSASPPQPLGSNPTPTPAPSSATPAPTLSTAAAREMLRMFQDEFKINKQVINFDSLVMGGSILMDSSAKRMPQNDRDRIRKYVQTLFILRDLKRTLIGGEVDLDSTATFKLNDVLSLEDDKRVFYKCRVFGANNANLNRFVVVIDNQVLLLEPMQDQRHKGVVRFVHPVEHVEPAVVHLGSGTKVLQLKCDASGKDIMFDKDYFYDTVKEEIEQCKRVITQKKLVLFSHLLGIKDEGDEWVLKEMTAKRKSTT